MAFAHNGYLDDAFSEADTSRLLANLIRWASGSHDAAGSSVAVGIAKYDKLQQHLRDEGFDARMLPTNDWPAQLQQYHVVILPIYKLDSQELTQLREYVKCGGGLLAANLGWAWRKYSAKPGQPIWDYTPNRLFSDAGIMWTEGYTKVPSNRRIRVTQPTSLFNANEAFQAFSDTAQRRRKLEPDELARMLFVLPESLEALPPDYQVLRSPIGEYLDSYIQRLPVPTAKAPIELQHVGARAITTLHAHYAKTAAPDAVKAHPAANTFPGAIPATAKRVARTVDVDTSIRDWHSTGLYAAPGEVVAVRAAPSVAGQGLAVRIGCHRDTLWHKEDWERVPDIIRVETINNPTTRIASGFGGLVYIVVPNDCKLGAIEVKIGGCVEAPYFVLGQTTVGEWVAKLRKQPAPWAELATSKFILTVPSSEIRDLDNPEELMTWWDTVLDAQAELRTTPKERDRPERMAVDEQLKSGYLHSGYPIMGQMEHGRQAVDLAALEAKGNWGFYHELGHNHQRGDWTYDGMGEVTVNSFSLYCYHKLDPRAPLHRSITAPAITSHIRNFMRDGEKGDPFLELVPYVQLQRAFGWETYQAVFREYEQLADQERPKNDQDKRDQWLIRFSRQAGKNLGPFFDFWKIGTTQTARDAVKNLPVWMPPELRRG